jgi:hypothetical protein
MRLRTSFLPLLHGLREHREFSIATKVIGHRISPVPMHD